MTLLPTIEINPPEQAIGSVIWLHGLGADGHDFASIVPELGLNPHCHLRFIFPHAPIRAITLNQGFRMRAWYDIESLEITSRANKAGIDESVTQLNALIAEEEARGIPTDKIVLAGFSQGAVIALITGLLHRTRLAGILFLSGYFPNPEEALQKAATNNRDIPIFMAHGTEDHVVSYALGQKAAAELKNNHYSISEHHYPMEHTVCVQEIRDISAWLTTIYK